MLSWDKTLKYVKANLSLPSTFIEHNEDEIKDYLKITALSEFSTYFPDWERTPVYPDTTSYKVPGKTNQYYFYDEECCGIFNVTYCYFALESELWSGHPMFGPYSMEHYKWFSLSTFRSKLFHRYSDMDRVYRYIQPNIVEILPDKISLLPFVVEYERSQPDDLSKINQAMEMTFMDLCLAHYMLRLGNLRSHYGQGNIQTPFGDIPLQGDTLKSEGNELRQRIVDRMSEQSLPDIFIEVD